jgi:hypothetical protein
VIQDPALQRLASQPLFLSILALAYRDRSAAELVHQSQTERLRRLFDQYLERMFEQQPTRPTQRRQLTRQLGIMARQMGAEKEFVIEQMQPQDWLHKPLHKWQYRLIIGLIVGLIVGLTYVLIGWPITGLISGLACILTCILIDVLPCSSDLRDTISFFEAIQTSTFHGKIQKSLRNIKIFLIFLLVFSSISWMNDLIAWLNWMLIFMVTLPLISSLPIGLIFGLPVELKAQIQRRTQPSQRIWNFRNTTILLSGASLAITALLYGGLAYTLPWFVTPVRVSVLSDRFSVLSFYAFLSFYAVLIVGGEACILHFALRLVLYWAKRIPWNFVTFFQQAQECLFIQRTGGSYIFIHRTLQEHFATLAPED